MLKYLVSEYSNIRGLTIQIWIDKDVSYPRYLGTMQIPENDWAILKQKLLLSGEVIDNLYINHLKRQQDAKDAKTKYLQELHKLVASIPSEKEKLDLISILLGHKNV